MHIWDDYIRVSVIEGLRRLKAVLNNRVVFTNEEEGGVAVVWAVGVVSDSLALSWEGTVLEGTRTLICVWILAYVFDCSERKVLMVIWTTFGLHAVDGMPTIIGSFIAVFTVKALQA